MKFEAVVEVRLRAGIADPEGATIQAAVRTLGFSDVSHVESAKSFRLILDAADQESALQRAREVSTRLLANPVLEDSTVTVSALQVTTS